MPNITIWYLHGISDKNIPNDLGSLHKTAKKKKFTKTILLETDKWDFLIREGVQKIPLGFVSIKELATTKRGIATGANSFFHISNTMALRQNISSNSLIPCVGRTADVNGFEFTKHDFEDLKRNDKNIYLVIFGKTKTKSEQEYIHKGEKQKINERYLLKKRNPWFSMEKQKAAPILVTVFGRERLRFIHNLADILTLTNFHCIYPFNTATKFVAALVLCLNLPSIQAMSRAHMRVYGRGLLKIEPKDILNITVPDLRKVSSNLINLMAEEQKKISHLSRNNGISSIDWSDAEYLVKKAVLEARSNPIVIETLEKSQEKKRLYHLRDVRMHHADQGELFDAQLQKWE